MPSGHGTITPAHATGLIDPVSLVKLVPDHVEAIQSDVMGPRFEPPEELAARTRS